MLRLISCLVIALIVDIIFLGPLGVTVYNVPVRRALIGILIVSSFVPTFVQRRPIFWQVAFIICVILFLVVWGGIIPQINGINLKYTIAEVQPAIALLLVLPFYHVLRYDGIDFYFNIVKACSALMGIVVIFVWIQSNILGNPGIGIAMRMFYISMNNTDLGVYIGPVADGTFRVMLINFILFPLMLCYHNWKKTDFRWSAFYGVAIFATGTRAFLGVWALIVGLSMLRRRPMLAIPLIVVVVGTAFAYMGSLQRLRIFEVGSELGVASSRYLQYFSLMSLFWQHPLLGSGLGANAIVIRSLDAPYSYELTYVALLAKLGAIGSGIVVLAVAEWTKHLIKATGHSISIFGLIAAIFLMTSTNPYLINLVGMTIVAFIIALGAQVDGAPRGDVRREYGEQQ